jgi:SAM-dependent methyltransferase
MDLSELSAGAWGLAALSACVESGLLGELSTPRTVDELASATGVPAPLVHRLVDVLSTMDLVVPHDDRWVVAPGLPSVELLGADLRTGLLQTHALYSAARRGELSVGWSYVDEDVLQAQGTMSAGAVVFLERVLFPSVPGMLERLRADGAAFLDVGAGVGAVTIEMCRRFPALRAVGIEPQDAPLALARANVEAAGLDSRVELRQQLIQDLPDEDAFDVVWLPGNFLPRDVLVDALGVVHRALRPGGLLLMATLGGGGDDLASAAARLRATLWGGDAVEPETVVELLERAGYTDITVLDRMRSGLRPIHARR